MPLDDHSPTPDDRRDAFRETAAPAIHRRSLWSLAAVAGALAPRGVHAAPPVSADPDPDALITPLVRRISLGITPDELARAETLGFHAYLEEQLFPDLIPDPVCDARLAPLSTIFATPSALFMSTTRPPTDRCEAHQLDALIYRALYSRRQLLERVVEFWTDHFNINIAKPDQPFLKPINDRDVIRANALSSFPQLLLAMGKSPSMLRYLDNYNSSKQNPNENYARELLELHSLGVTGGYTQQDVRELARALTGWTFFSGDPANGTLCGTFRFRSETHDDGPKTLLGNSLPDGNSTLSGEVALGILAHHPATARNISAKLCRWFLGERVPTSTVNHITSIYTQTDGNIRAILRAILTPANLVDAAPKLKRPYHFLMSALRGLGANVQNADSIRGQFFVTGQRVYRWPAPDGFPDDNAHWSGLLQPRWNFAHAICSGANNFAGDLAGLSFDDEPWFEEATTAEQLTRIIDQRLFAGGMPENERVIIRDYLAFSPSSRQRRREAVALALSSPGFQWN